MVNDCLVIQCCRHYELAPDPHSKIKKNEPPISGQNCIKIVAPYPSLKRFVPKWVNLFMKQIPKLLLLPNEAQRPSNDICAMKIGLKLTNSKQITAILVCTDSKAALKKLSNIITITTKNSKLGLAKASGPIALSQQAQQYNWPIAQQFYEWKS